ncbi:MAG: apolipoprotein N-acyltransferase, partial [Endomicrobiaceae bacterium]|nr:apolipoprotein N-acyltransferase [Endomicrobiaceae bacterium]
SFQKFNFFLFAWIAFIPLIYCAYKNNLKYSALYGFVTGIVYSVIAFNWMFLFLLKNTKSSPDSFIVSTIVWICMSLYFVVWTIIIKYCSLKIKNYRFITAIFAAAVWTVLEYIRNYYFGSFPVNLLGYSQSSFIQLIQFADIFGIYGISFVIILINCFLFYWLKDKDKKYLIISIIIMLSLFVYGQLRINQISKINNENKIEIGVVQPNILQAERWNKKHKRNIINKIIKNVDYFKEKNIDVLLYPETVLPGYLDEDKDIEKLVNSMSAYSNISLIGGMSIENRKIYNSIFIVSNQGNLIDKYKKKHLIIFGEYIPFYGFLEKFFSRFISNNNLTNEIELNVFKFKDFTLGINICSENYYPYLSRELVLKGATLLTTHSNDAWCDGLSYPYQHFVLNIFRAVENRKYLIVASNTGISGVIAPTGKIVRQTKNREQVCFEETVYTNNCTTIYDKIGELFVYLCIAYIVLILLICGIFVIRKKC